MTSPEIQQAAFLDLLFENRNKLYGAYTLRKQYNQRMITALCIAISAAMLLFTCMTLAKNGTGTVVSDGAIEDVILRTHLIPEQPKPPEPVQRLKPQPPAAPVAQQQVTQIRITPDPITTADVPAQSDIADVAISTTTATGAPADVVPALTEKGSGTQPESEVKPAPADAAPQFPGGAAAWMAFLSRNLRVPESLEAGEKKTVLVQFFVREDGRVTDFEVLQSGGNDFDAEVIRVLKKMPKWKPALQRGAPVAVSFTQPVTFMATGD